jgi:chromosome segregation ATPase
MPDHFGHNRGELAKAQLILEDAESKLERLHSLIVERRTERQSLSSLIQDIAATGDMDKLVSLQSRAVALEKALAELSAAETDCIERVQSARRYLYTLYVRLEKLRQEFSSLMRRLAAIDQGENIPSDVQTNLGRVKIQLKAITGENSTGRL